MRNAFARALHRAALADERIVILAADISPAGPLAGFAREFPRRFLNVGVAEQAMIGMAAGMALKGLRPFCYTIAPFALYRPFEFIRDDLAYQQLPVTVVGMGAGLTYSTLGSTHHAQEDVAVACAVPGLQVLAPCDPKATASAVEYCAVQDKGPVYLRIGKAGEPDLPCVSGPWSVDALQYHRWGVGTIILGMGPIVALGLQVGEEYGCAVASCHSLKPLPVRCLQHVLSNYERVIVLEEHSPIGGLGSKVKELACDAGYRGVVRCVSIADEFIHFHGERDALLQRHGLTKDRVVAFLHN